MLVLQYTIVKIRYTTINEQFSLNPSTDVPFILESLGQDRDCTPGKSGFHSWQGQETFLCCVGRLRGQSNLLSNGYQGVKMIIY
jgi:hypothetical protein